MWIWLDKNGTVKQYLMHGPSPIVGETNFQIFAYFDGLDTDFFDSATIKFRKPDKEGNTYPILFMKKVSLPYEYMEDDGTMSNFQEEQSPYTGFLFDFSDFTSGEEIVRLLDTPGLWEATITLLGSPNKTNVSGLITFNVGSTAFDSEDETQLTLDQILENLVLAQRIVKKDSTYYLKVSNNFIEEANSGQLDSIIYSIGSIVFDIETHKFYKIQSITINEEDELKAYATYEEIKDLDKISLQNRVDNLDSAVYVYDGTKETFIEDFFAAKILNNGNYNSKNTLVSALIRNNSDNNEFLKYNVYLEAGEHKIIYENGEVQETFTILKSGNYDVYFRPAGNPSWGNSKVFVTFSNREINLLSRSIVSNYFLKGTFNNWENNFPMYETESQVIYWGIFLHNGDEFKIENNGVWYPSLNNYRINATSFYDITLNKSTGEIFVINSAFAPFYIDKVSSGFRAYVQLGKATIFDNDGVTRIYADEGGNRHIEPLNEIAFGGDYKYLSNMPIDIGSGTLDEIFIKIVKHYLDENYKQNRFFRALDSNRYDLLIYCVNNFSAASSYIFKFLVFVFDRYSDEINLNCNDIVSYYVLYDNSNDTIKVQKRYSTKDNIDSRYIKPNNGIPKTDFASDIQSDLEKIKTNQLQIDQLYRLIGKPNGLAELDENGFVPSNQLPSYVDDVVEFNKEVSGSNFLQDTLSTEYGTKVWNDAPLEYSGETYYKKFLINVDGTEENIQVINPESSKIYINISNSKTYRWSGSSLVEISESISLNSSRDSGNSSTAYQSRFGAQNYEDILQLQLTKYTKPSTGIPETDLSSDVKQKLNSGSNIIDITPYLTFTSPDEGTISNEGYGIILNNAFNNKNILYFVGQQQSYLYFKVENLLSGDNINFTILLSSAMSQFLDFKILIYKENEVNKFSMISSASISVNDNYDGTISIFNRDTTQGGTTYTKEKVDELLLNKYTKPASGIPKTDLSSDVQTSLEKANTAVQPDALLSYCLAVDAAHTLEMTIDSSTYILTAKLKNKAGEVLGTPQTIDLLLETMVVNGKYDADSKSIILTLKNGQTITFSVADLVSGLQTEITSENKLSADLVKDGSTNKVFTTDDKNSLQRMQTDLEHIGPIIDKVGQVVDLTPYITFTSGTNGTITQEGYNLIDLTKPNVYKITHPALGDIYAIVNLKANTDEYQLNAILYDKTNVDTIVVFNLAIYSNLNLSLKACIVPLITYVDEKYTKPSTGIPESDLDSSVQTKLNKPIEQIEATSLNDALATITNSIKGNNDYTSNGYRQKIYVFKNNNISESYYIFPLHYGISISRDFNQHFLVIEGLKTANAEFNYYRCTIPSRSSSATEDNVSKIGTLKDDFTNVVNKTSETSEDLPNRLKITIPIKYRASNLFDFEEDIFHKVYYDCLIIESTPLTLDFYNEIKDNNGTVRIVLNHPVKNRFKNIGIPSQISRKGKLGFYHYANFLASPTIDLENMLANETIVLGPNDLVGKNGKWIIRKVIPLRDILNIVLPDIYKPISYGNNTIPTLGMDSSSVGSILSYRQQFDAVSKQLVNLPFGSPLRHGWRRGVINRQIFYPINQLNTNEDTLVEGRFLIHKGGYSIRSRLTTGGQGGYLFAWNPEGTPDYSKKNPRWSFNRCAVGFSLCKLNHPVASEYVDDEPIFAKKYPLANKKLVLKSTPYVSPGFSVDYQTYCKTEINLKDNK